jgi:hypothetical protein
MVVSFASSGISVPLGRGNERGRDFAGGERKRRRERREENGNG